jgi:23S rRNA A2030 N6-methylase RlmJ
MSIKDRATAVRRLQRDDGFNGLIADIKKDQGDIFFNPHSSFEDREDAHQIIRALMKIEDRMAQILQDEAIYDKKRK